MKPNFEVLIRRTTFGYVRVNATSEKEAKRKALAQLEVEGFEGTGDVVTKATFTSRLNRAGDIVEPEVYKTK